MIGYLRGDITHHELDHVILMTGGVGYKVFTAESFLSEAKEVELWIYTAVRETALDLYGFSKRDSLLLFELLLSVSGIGPKSALAIMAAATLNDLRSAAAENDPSSLTKVSGIGKKTAAKIVLELRDKLETTVFTETDDSVSYSGEALDALLSLGYSREEARKALKSLDTAKLTTSEIVRQALKNLSE